MALLSLQTPCAQDLIDYVVDTPHMFYGTWHGHVEVCYAYRRSDGAIEIGTRGRYCGVPHASLPSTHCFGPNTMLGKYAAYEVYATTETSVETNPRWPSFLNTPVFLYSAIAEYRQMLLDNKRENRHARLRRWPAMGELETRLPSALVDLVREYAEVHTFGLDTITQGVEGDIQNWADPSFRAW